VILDLMEVDYRLPELHLEEGEVWLMLCRWRSTRENRK
jgi:hypothetical protein